MRAAAGGELTDQTGSCGGTAKMGLLPPLQGRGLPGVGPQPREEEESLPKAGLPLGGPMHCA